MTSMQMKISIPFSKNDADFKVSGILSAWNRKFKILTDQAGIVKIGKFVIESNELVSEVVFVIEKTTVKDILDVFNKHLPFMKPKNKKARYQVQTFRIKEQPKQLPVYHADVLQQVPGDIYEKGDVQFGNP